DDGDAEVSSPASQVSDRPVIAVLPFDNLSAEVDSYFADGLTEDITTKLSRFRELQIIARTSSFRFREAGDDLSAFCATLGAGHAVVGSVRRAGGRLRIGAQLVDAATGV